MIAVYSDGTYLEFRIDRNIIKHLRLHKRRIIKKKYTRMLRNVRKEWKLRRGSGILFSALAELVPISIRRFSRNPNLWKNTHEEILGSKV